MAHEVLSTEAMIKSLDDFWFSMRQLQDAKETACASTGITSQWFHVLLIVRSFGASDGPTISDIAKSLIITHHSAVHLTKKLEIMGLVVRIVDPVDTRKLHVRLTSVGLEKVDLVASQHLPCIRGLEFDRMTKTL